MSSFSNRPVTRETEVIIEDKPLIVTLDPAGSLSFRIKNKHKKILLPVAAAYKLALDREATPPAAE